MLVLGYSATANFRAALVCAQTAVEPGSEVAQNNATLRALRRVRDDRTPNKSYRHAEPNSD
jgi:hypothetical protein